MSKLKTMDPMTVDLPDGKDEQDLKGTFVSVLLLGGFLVAVWILVFAIYLIRP